MARPSKPSVVIKNEHKSHRTKAEMLAREEGEKALLSGKQMKERQEVKDNVVAHKEFLRVNNLMVLLEKNDALYEPIINRYCEIQGELSDLVTRRNMLYGTIDMINETYENLKESLEDDEEKIAMLFGFTNNLTKLVSSVIRIDKDIKDKRKQLFDIEKECCMTIAAALRTVPKTPEKKVNPLLEALSGD